MNSEQPTNENIDPTPNSAPAPEPPPIDTAPTGQPATAQQLTNVEQRMSSFERSTLRWTRAMFIVTAGTGLFICFQWLEMRSGGEQTERIIKADERLAKAM